MRYRVINEITKEDFVLKKKHKRRCAIVLAAVTMLQGVPSYSNINQETVIHAEEAEHFYTQKGWTYNNTTLKSMCYITSYAMVLRSLGLSVNPVDVYIANGCSNYCNHNKIGAYYNMNVTNNKTVLFGKTSEEREAYIKALLPLYPQGIIVGGNYGGGTHYVVAKKVENNVVYFDDPAQETAEAGCCIDISSVYKLNWGNITDYTIVQPGTQDITTIVDAQPDEIPSVEADVVTDGPVPTIAPTETPVVQATEAPAPVVEEILPTATAEAPTPSPVYNPLNKYTVPTKTIFFQKPPMKGDDIKWLEAALKKLGYPCKVNGKYTKADRKLVKKYQAIHNLEADGYVGTKTRQQLINDLALKIIKIKKVSGLKLSKNSITTMSVSSGHDYTLVATWKANTDISGYEVAYSTNKDFSNAKYMFVQENEACISDLSEKEIIYVKVRAYKKIADTKIYGSYSNVKKIP